MYFSSKEQRLLHFNVLFTWYFGPFPLIHINLEGKKPKSPEGMTSGFSFLQSHDWLVIFLKSVSVSPSRVSSALHNVDTLGDMRANDPQHSKSRRVSSA